MSALDLRLPDVPSQWPRIVAEAIREAVERRFREELPRDRRFDVAARERPGYTEVMVFIANIEDEPELQQTVRKLASALQVEVTDKGYPTSILISPYAPATHPTATSTRTEQGRVTEDE